MPVPFDLIRPTLGLPPGAALAEPVSLDLPPASQDGPFGPYVLSEDLATAANVALCLGQPLLVTGEPGCGKTSLAWGVARQLGAPVLEFHTKSTSVARDLFYTFDAVRRFHDASVHDEGARDASRYVSWSALGQAIRSPRTCVVLIDEVDKAPRDFPNDLLNELDRMEFTVQETSPPQRYTASARHFVLITSNSERRLPLPFLRRCTYAHVPFPDPEGLRRIVEVHGLGPGTAFASVAVRRFLDLRAVDGLVKPPSTGELLAWVRVLGRMGVDEQRLAALPLDRLPALEVLVKILEDRHLLARLPRA